MKALDITDRTFGRLTVLGRDGASPYGTARWRCICSCGETLSALSTSLRSGATRSCGCLRVEATRARRTQHGATVGGRSKTYRIWEDMKARCENPADVCFKSHGAVGITMDPAWRDYAVFLADMGEAPPGQTLGRYDVDGNYSKGNCRWGTRGVPRTRVPADTIRRVRALHSEGRLMQKDIAAQYRLATSTVCNIINRMGPFRGAIAAP